MGSPAKGLDITVWGDESEPSDARARAGRLAEDPVDREIEGLQSSPPGEKVVADKDSGERRFWVA